MAHSLRRPLSSVLGLTSSNSCRRCFSAYQPLGGVDRQAQHASIRPPTAADRSLRVASKQANVIPSDLGLLEQTYIAATGKNRPNPLTSPNDFLHSVWNRTFYRARDIFSLLVLKLSSPAAKKGGFRRSLQLKNSKVAPTAVALHTQMYTAFAEGDTNLLRKLCTDGLYDTFSTRIGNRQKGERVKWELLKYNKRAKTVSDRAARLPIEGMAVRQSVVRISSRQRLTRWKKVDGVEVMVEGSGKEKDVVEYVVVQKLWREWKDGDWMVWGTTKEVTLDNVDEWMRKAKE